MDHAILGKSGLASSVIGLGGGSSGRFGLAKGGTKTDATKQLPGIDEVSGEAAQLYNELEQADAIPTAALLAAAAHVEEEAKEVLPRWENFKQTQIPEMNRQLQREHHPAIQPNQRPANMPEEGDED